MQRSKDDTGLYNLRRSWFLGYCYDILTVRVFYSQTGKSLTGGTQ